MRWEIRVSRQNSAEEGESGTGGTLSRSASAPPAQLRVAVDPSDCNQEVDTPPIHDPSLPCLNSCTRYLNGALYLLLSAEAMLPPALRGLNLSGLAPAERRSRLQEAMAVAAQKLLAAPEQHVAELRTLQALVADSDSMVGRGYRVERD